MLNTPIQGYSGKLDNVGKLTTVDTSIEIIKSIGLKKQVEKLRVLNSEMRYLKTKLQEFTDAANAAEIDNYKKLVKL
jgi:hypothetical protein